jgi:maltooligosyltrehalose trehalohydrolase
VVRPERFAWTDRDWPGVRRENLVFYEMHVGSFTAEGTFEAVIPRLDSLRGLGVTAVQLMPVAQFPGGRNWGYDGVAPYAAQSSYGGPHGLQRLVDACHAAGLAVFLDVVYNHLGPEGNYLSEFGPYFTDHYRTGWGQAFNYDGAGSDPVRDFVVDNVRMWLEEFHLDGLRLDAVHAVYDLGARHILRAVQETADEAGRRGDRAVHVVAESDLNDPRLLLPPEQGGYGLSAQWSDDFHHALHAFFTGERQGYYQDFGRLQDLPRVLQRPFLYAGDYSPFRDRRHGAPPGDLTGDRFVVAVQNHDQVGNRARGDRLTVLLPDPARQRLTAGLLLFAPYLPLLFMGEEYGEENPFPFFCSFNDPDLVRNVREGRRREFAAFAWQGEVPDPQAEETFRAARLSWSWPEGTARAGLRRLYADLLAARRTWPPLRDFTRRSARLLPEPESGAVMELIRGGPPEFGETLQVYFNLTDRPQPFPGAVGGTELLFTSESRRYAGARQGAEGSGELLPFECVAFGPGGWPKFF